MEPTGCGGEHARLARVVVVISSLKRPLGRAGEHGWTAWGLGRAPEPPMSRGHCGSMCRDGCRTTPRVETISWWCCACALSFWRDEPTVLPSAPYWCHGVRPVQDRRRGQLGLGLIGVWWTGRRTASAHGAVNSVHCPPDPIETKSSRVLLSSSSLEKHTIRTYYRVKNSLF